MDKNSEKEKLNDELLNKVSGGCGEVDVILVGELTCPNCEGNPALYLMSTDDSGRLDCLDAPAAPIQKRSIYKTAIRCYGTAL